MAVLVQLRPPTAFTRVFPEKPPKKVPKNAEFANERKSPPFCHNKKVPFWCNSVPPRGLHAIFPIFPPPDPSIHLFPCIFAFFCPNSSDCPIFPLREAKFTPKPTRFLAPILTPKRPPKRPKNDPKKLLPPTRFRKSRGLGGIPFNR